VAIDHTNHDFYAFANVVWPEEWCFQAVSAFVRPCILIIATLVHKCLTGHAPAYLAEYCRQAGTRRPGMRSAGTSMLDVPRTVICCRRPTHLEQLASWHSWCDTVCGNICNTVENLPVCLTAAAPVFLNWRLRNVHYDMIWYDCEHSVLKGVGHIFIKLSAVIYFGTRMNAGFKKVKGHSHSMSKGPVGEGIQSLMLCVEFYTFWLWMFQWNVVTFSYWICSERAISRQSLFTILSICLLLHFLN